MIIHTHTHTENIARPFKKKKKNKVLPFVAKWVDPEIIILSKEIQRGKYYINFMWNLKNTNELIYKLETDSQT